MSVKTFRLILGGVSCNGCVNKIRQALLKSDPDIDLGVDLDSKLATIQTTLALMTVQQQIADLGYQTREVAASGEQLSSLPSSFHSETSRDNNTLDNQALNSQALNSQALDIQEPESLVPFSETGAAAPTPTVQIRMLLTGITCAGCVATVESALKSVSGVDTVALNFANRTVQIDGTASAASLIKAVQQAGYGASEVVDPALAEQQRERSRLDELAYKRRAVVLALGLGLPMMAYGMLAGMAVDTPLRQWGWGGAGLLTLVVMVFAGGHFYSGAWRSARRFGATMDTLIALGTGSAWGYSMLVVAWPELLPPQSRGLYFEASLMIIGLVNLGQVLELRARGQTQQAIRGLLDLQPKRARVVRLGQELDVAIEQVVVGELLRLRPGETVAVDGEVVEGTGLVDEAMLTGESQPVEKTISDTLSAGTLNTQGAMLYRATRVGHETALAKIIELVQQAQNSKPPISQLADRVAAIFVPIVMMIAVLTALVWWWLGPEPQAVYMLVTAVTVLIIACPCALGLATPISTMIGIGKAAEKGVLIRNGDALQRASEITTLVMDKTGTLTLGRPEVVSMALAGSVNRDQLLEQVLQLELQSQHPLAGALTAYCRLKLSLDSCPEREQCQAEQPEGSGISLDQFHSFAGLGLQANFNQKRLAIGNQRLMEQLEVDLTPLHQQALQWESQARTVVYISSDQQLVGIVAIEDPLRPEAAAALQRLKQQGLKLVMLTGDNRETAESVCLQLSIDQFRSQLLPGDKLQAIKQLQKQGERVGMVGDGINDAPALSQSDVGFAIGSGADVAIESADVALMYDSLHGLADSVSLSRATLTNIKQNLWGAFIYNSIGIPVAAGVLFPLTGLLLNPVIAGLAMSLSSVTVVANANRLRRLGRD